MVIALFISLAFVGAIALLCFKGITVRYDKKFTIEDNRNKSRLTEEELKLLEAKLNAANPKTQTVDDDKYTPGPMDAVIAEIQDLFGPEKDDKGDK
jgi:hypothetical protein